MYACRQTTKASVQCRAVLVLVLVLLVLLVYMSQANTKQHSSCFVDVQEEALIQKQYTFAANSMCSLLQLFHHYKQPTLPREWL